MTLDLDFEMSHTQGLVDISTGIMENHGVEVDWDAGCRYDFANPECR